MLFSLTLELKSNSTKQASIENPHGQGTKQNEGLRSVRQGSYPQRVSRTIFIPQIQSRLSNPSPPMKFCTVCFHNIFSTYNLKTCQTLKTLHEHESSYFHLLCYFNLTRTYCHGLLIFFHNSVLTIQQACSEGQHQNFNF